MDFARIAQIPEEAQIAVIRAMQSLGMFSSTFDDNVQVLLLQLEQISFSIGKRPLMVSNGRSLYLCDRRYLPSGVTLAKVTQMGASETFAIMIEGKEVVVDPRIVTTKFLERYKYDVQAIDMMAAVYMLGGSCSSDEDDGLGRSPQELLDHNFSRDRMLIVECNSKHKTKMRQLIGSSPRRALCLICNFVVIMDGHRERCRKGVGVPVEISNSLMQRDALRGDLAQKYHFLTIAEKLGEVDAYQRLSHLFSNKMHKKFLMSGGKKEKDVVSFYKLTVGNSDHTWGTVVEAEYHRSLNFRRRYMVWLCFEQCGWSVSNDIYDFVLNLCCD